MVRRNEPAHDDEGVTHVNGRKVVVLLIAALALVAAGCGGDSKNEASADTETTVVTETTTSEDTTATTDSSATLDGRDAASATSRASAPSSQASRRSSPSP